MRKIFITILFTFIFISLVLCSFSEMFIKDSHKMHKACDCCGSSCDCQPQLCVKISQPVDSIKNTDAISIIFPEENFDFEYIFVQPEESIRSIFHPPKQYS
ncbi:MAG: hypothetical protein KJ593_07270 [Candidatus Omnitrophica bacterium]|nr:hypothetical protein [Candidatus Omnitrophota bacterium]